MSRKNLQKRKEPLPKLSRQTATILGYWRRSIADGRRMEVPGREIADYGVFAELPAISTGQISVETAQTVLIKGEERLGRDLRGSKSDKRNNSQRTARGNSAELHSSSVLIAPLRGERLAGGGLNTGPRYVEPIWIPATLAHDGSLTPPNHPCPWIPRTYLEPVGREGAFSVGELDDADKFFDDNPPPADPDWRSYWSYCEAFFNAVSGANFSNWSADGFEVYTAGLIIADTSGVWGGLNLERPYDDILNGHRLPGLAEVLASTKTPHRRLIAKKGFGFASKAKRHLGQFGSSYALSPSQRLAVHQALTLNPGEILTVTGPPGTGKTTLIQSIVASLWVARAVVGGRPPVIVVCSATNQAVTNVIESFAKADNTEGVLAGRWLPDLVSLATYCASFSKAEESKIPQLELTDGTGFSSYVETWDYYTKAEANFLERVAAYGLKTKSVKKAAAYLQRALSFAVGSIRRKISRQVWRGFFLRLVSGDLNQADLTELLAALDTNERNTAFRIAVHYWEARWLIEVGAALTRKELPTKADPISGNSNRRNRLASSRADWERRAMITPCFVATFATVGRFFGRERDEVTPPIDLMIADEAGQVSIETSAAQFALAERGIVIGDTEQLEPIWNINAANDSANLIDSGLLKKADPQGRQDLIRAGIAAYGSSLMRRAISVCPVQDHSTIGVFLAEHRRSVKRIVEFANHLSYRGRLQPLRDEPLTQVLPAFGYAHVLGVCSMSGKSRFNAIEAECLAAWLDRNCERLEDHYKKNLAQFAAVLTPFVAQNRKLRSLLHGKYPEMTIGTVNSLQGAERSVVLFSPVYDRQIAAGRMLFDRSPNFLNVAVTRAKDSFLVFGDMDVFDESVQSPSGALARFLFESPENEIVDIERPVRKSEGILERLSTLEQHREALFTALRTAKHEVLIVSPTISIHPLKHDRIDQEIEHARERGVRVVVYTDQTLDADNSGVIREASRLGRELLLQSGAELYVARRIHNKGLATDDDELVEGSFNWLSAVRKRDSANQKLEVSLRFTGRRAADEIRSLKADMRARVVRS